MNSNLLDKVYPVGSIYMNVNDTDPSLLFGGEWERIAKGRTLIGVDESDTDFSPSQKTGGEKSHTLTVNETPSHAHIWQIRERKIATASGSDILLGIGNTTQYWTSGVGGGQPHNNLQPYLTCYIWERVA